MTQNLGEDHILLANPPLVKAYGDPHQLHRAVGHEGYADNVEEFLHIVRVSCQERIRVLGKVVGAMELPEALHLVRRAMEAVIPEVKHQWIHAGFEESPEVSDRGWTLVGTIGEEGHHHRTQNHDRQDCLDSLRHTTVRDTIASMLVTVEESVSVANAAEDVYLMYNNGFYRQAIEEIGKPWREVVAKVIDVELMQEQWYGGVEKHVAMKLPFRGIGHFLCLVVYCDVFVKIQVVYIEQLQKPVPCMPLRPIPQTPGGFHRVFRVVRE